MEKEVEGEGWEEGERGDRVVRVGERVWTEWGEASVREVYGDGDVACEWVGYDGVFTISFPVVVVGDRVGTEWGEARVSVVYGDGDLGCTWKEWEGVFSVSRWEVWLIEL